jgi:hypothetical protein
MREREKRGGELKLGLIYKNERIGEKEKVS